MVVLWFVIKYYKGINAASSPTRAFFLLFVFVRVLLDDSCYTKFLSALVSSRTLLFASQNLASISISLGRSTSF